MKISYKPERMDEGVRKSEACLSREHDDKCPVLWGKTDGPRPECHCWAVCRQHGLSVCDCVAQHPGLGDR